ncbi:MAG: hypothetical protein QXO55_07390 [Candidatus Korarchaeum sp.]
MEGGRYVLLRKYYRRGDLLVGLPSLVLTEVTLGHFSRWGCEGLKYKVIRFKGWNRCYSKYGKKA